MKVIAGGTVIDGTGAPRRVADVGIVGGEIVAVGDLSHADAERVDARGLFVAPGFIDLHTHSDMTLLQSPGFSSTLRQGVTTELCGNCGMQVGLALDTPEFALEQRLARGSRGFRWTSMAEFLALAEERQIAANVAFLAGHGTLRKRVMGWEMGPPDADALCRMRDLLRRTMEEGAFGFSTGLEYAPGRYAQTDELTALAQEVAAAGGLYATHLRNEAEGLIESVEEALAIARGSGAALQLSHHKAEGRRHWGTVERTLAMIDAARAAGLDAACDVYPYTAFMTGLGVRTLPAWAQEGSIEQVAESLRDPSTRDRVLVEMTALGLDWERIQIAIARNHREVQGLSLADIARERGVTPPEAVVDLIIAENGLVTGISFEIDEEDMRRVMRYEHTSIGSDSATRAITGPLAEDLIHPRGFGTFPRVLGRYARDEGVLSWEQAVRKMTGLPASRLGLKRRGVLAPGAHADLVLFDPATIVDTATYENPFQYPAGIRHVYVNGTAVIQDGEETGARPGRVLRKGCPE